MLIKFKKLDPRATIPTRAHADDLGLDLYALEDTDIPSYTNGLVRTGIACEFPELIGGILKDRSSVAGRRVYVKAGVIDPSYRGEIKILLENPKLSPALIKAGDKIAQMVLIGVIQTDIQETDTLNDTVRGINGFGSTGT